MKRGVNKRTGLLIIFCMALVTTLWGVGHGRGEDKDTYVFSDKEKGLIKSLWIGSLPDVPDDPSNDYDTDPEAAKFGRKVFHDVRFSRNGEVACSTCHPRGVNFVDNRPLARGIGTTDRRTMPLIGVGYNTWFFWDGRKDSLWSQALGPFENQVEHGITRVKCIQLVYDQYKDEYESIFGVLPYETVVDIPAFAGPQSQFALGRKAWEDLTDKQKDQVNTIYSNVGKAIAAFVRLIVPLESKFDRFAEAVNNGDLKTARELYTPGEARGLKMFIGDKGCVNCHVGPLFTNSDFHDLLIPPRKTVPSDHGRAIGMEEVRKDEFNCLGPYSDAEGESECAELAFMDTNTDKYWNAFKTPTLRNVAERRFYMHAGQLEALHDVFDHYRAVADQVPELEHAALTAEEEEDLIAFLHTLTSPLKILAPFDEKVEPIE